MSIRDYEMDEDEIQLEPRPMPDKIRRQKERLARNDRLNIQKWGYKVNRNEIDYERRIEELKFRQLKDQYRRENEMEYLRQTPIKRQIAENSDYNAKMQYIMKHYEAQMNGPSAVDTMIDMFYKPAIAIGAGYLTSIMASEFVPMSTWGTLIKAVGL